MNLRIMSAEECLDTDGNGYGYYNEDMISNL